MSDYDCAVCDVCLKKTYDYWCLCDEHYKKYVLYNFEYTKELIKSSKNFIEIMTQLTKDMEINPQNYSKDKLIEILCGTIEIFNELISLIS
jgi:hypothetical protein